MVRIPAKSIRAGLGHRDGREQCAGGQPREPALALLIVGVVQEVRQNHFELSAYRRQRDERSRGFLLQDNVVAVVGLPTAAVLLRDGNAHHAGGAELLESRTRHPAGLLPLWVGGHDLFLDEVPAQARETPRGPR